MKTIDVAIKFAIFSLLAYLFFLIVKPFISAIVLAAVFAMVFHPLLQKIKKHSKLSNDFSVFLTVFTTLIFFILPMILLIIMIGNEAINFIGTVDVGSLQQNIVNLQKVEILGFKIDLSMFKDKIISITQSIGTYLSSKSLSILTSIWGSILMFFVFMLFYYYLLKDGKQLLLGLQKALPYKKSQEKLLFKSFQEISRTIFYGNLISAVIAGVIAYIGFLVFDFKGALIWGLLAGILSFIPTAGTLLVYATGIVLLFFSSGWILALSMALYYAVADLFFREHVINSKILDDKLQFHPINVFFALAGGVAAFGSLGLIYGPLIITALGTLYRFHVSDAKSKRQ